MGQVVSNVSPKLSDVEISGVAKDEIALVVAHTLSILVGAVMLFIGLLRLGWIIEFVPYVVVSSFVTAASITIMSTQIATALGIKITTSNSPFFNLLNTAKNLPNARVDAAIGIGSIVLLFAIRDFCTMMQKRQPTQKRTWSYISSLRLSFSMILFTLISYLVNRNHVEHPKFQIVGYIESGFKGAGVPKIDGTILGLVASELPAVVLILVIEHIAIAKAMGRQFDYIINPSQEMVAIGAANILSPFVGGYVCTGSFGASAVVSKAGVRTPLAGFFSAGVLFLALQVLTGVFRFIPKAALAGLIIHAVCNLVTPPKRLYKYWQLSPPEFLIWISCLAVAIFKDLKAAIYTGVGLSFALMLVRLARTKGHFLGRAQGQHVASDTSHALFPGSINSNLPINQNVAKDIFLPLDRTESEDVSNSKIKVETPYPGVFIYRFRTGFNYTNQAFHIDLLLKFIEENTRRTSVELFEKVSDRPWNYVAPKETGKSDDDQGLPLLRAVILDFGAVNVIDITAIQGLIDLRNSLDRYCAPDAVEVHFAHIYNRWTRRALAASGFGYPSSQNKEALGSWQPAYTIAAVLDPELNETRSCKEPDVENNEIGQRSRRTPAGGSTIAHDATNERFGMAAVHGVDRPFFHNDLSDAVDAAVRDAVFKDAKLGLNSS